MNSIFFDAVGTLLFPTVPVTETYGRIAERQGVEIDEAALRIRLRASFEKQEQIDALAGWRTDEERERERWRQIVGEALPEVADAGSCFEELWEFYRSPTAWRVHPETDEVLTSLSRRGITLGMASNFDARLTGIISGHPALAPLADRCAISSLVGWRKPAPEFFREVARMAECNVERILFIGDDLRNDFRGARAAGMRALLYDPTGAIEIVERIASFRDLCSRVAEEQICPSLRSPNPA